jgi:hypothetical protein
MQLPAHDIIVTHFNLYVHKLLKYSSFYDMMPVLTPSSYLNNCLE